MSLKSELCRGWSHLGASKFIFGGRIDIESVNLACLCNKTKWQESHGDSSWVIGQNWFCVGSSKKVVQNAQCFWFFLYGNWLRFENNGITDCIQRFHYYHKVQCLNAGGSPGVGAISRPPCWPPRPLCWCPLSPFTGLRSLSRTSS